MCILSVLCDFDIFGVDGDVLFILKSRKTSNRLLGNKEEFVIRVQSIKNDNLRFTFWALFSHHIENGFPSRIDDKFSRWLVECVIEFLYSELLTNV